MLQKPYLLRNHDRTWICNMYENATLCNVILLKRVFVNNFYFRKEMNNNICCNSCAKKILGLVFYIDICTHHRMSSQNVDLNICAHTWYSLSVMGHKQDVELAVPVMRILSNENENNFTHLTWNQSTIIRFPCNWNWNGMELKRNILNDKIIFFWLGLRMGSSFTRILNTPMRIWL